MTALPITYSPHQERIFSFVKESQKSAIVIAVAGAGKTTTLLEAFRRVEQRTLMLAFNKTIADELKSRVPAHVQAATFHSIGFSAWTRYVGGRVTVDGQKVRDIMREEMSPKEGEMYGSFVAKMVSLAKAAGMGYLIGDVESEWAKLADHYDVSPDAENAKLEEGIAIARHILNLSNECAKRIVDFDDMLFMPLIKDVTFPKFPFVCIDEAQDTNGVQRALLKRMLTPPSGRLIAVGDPKQAIYGFRGADSSAMDKIREEFQCEELPLTVSYRCPRAVVKHAQSIVPYIEASDRAPEGAVAHNPGFVDESGKFQPWAFEATDAILCRNTAPLVSMAYRLIAKRVGCRIIGRDIGAGLVALIKKLNAKGIEKLLEKLTEFETREVERALSKDETTKAESIKDKCDCIRIVINSLPEQTRTVPKLVEAIQSLFGDKANGMLTLCTVHKAKGMEWQRVYILDAEKYMPSKWAKRPWQKEQELNLMYVAYTRAKLELAFISSEREIPESAAA